MSGTIQGFIDNYGGLANNIGSQTGIAPSSLLAQWANETNYGQSFAGTNNLGNIMGSNGQPANYSSVTDFGNAFVGLLNSNYPNAENTGSNLSGFVSGLGQGSNGGSYYGNQSPASYLSTLSGESSLFNALGVSGSGSGSSSGSSSGSGSYMSNFANMFNGVGGVLGGFMGGSAGSNNTGAGLLQGAGSSSGSGSGSSGSLSAYITEIATRAGLIIIGLVFILGAFYLMGQSSHGSGVEGEIGGAARNTASKTAKAAGDAFEAIAA
jgi:hypothetical protein